MPGLVPDEFDDFLPGRRVVGVANHDPAFASDRRGDCDASRGAAA
jgi:hypothetical protein